jgi:uroporphyrinogen III methyltransferase/synthase
LQAGGAEVIVAPCYQTVPDHSNVEVARAALEQGSVDWVTFTSSSTVRNFLDALGEDFVQAKRDGFKVACIGPVTAQTAQQHGLEPDATAADASVEALIEILSAAAETS